MSPYFNDAKRPGLRVVDLLWDELTIGRPALPSNADTLREPCGWLVVADLMV